MVDTVVERRKRKKDNGGVKPASAAAAGSELQTAPPQPSEQSIEQLRALHRRRRSKLVLWYSPVTTLHYCTREVLHRSRLLAKGVLQHKVKVTVIGVFLLIFFLGVFLDGPHHDYLANFEKKTLWYCYWVGLGVLSSVGLGTGLHTFLLYLGPFIASVTLAAFDCNSVDFPEPPYPQDVICPDGDATMEGVISFWTVMSKVRMEAIMWGAGTAIGELPPYFMARAARLSEHEEDDVDEYEEIEAVLHSQRRDPLTRAKKFMHRLVERVGFFGILLSASIPNPLFDLAGITCGHFLVPFWTFFGATLVGKAIIKMHLQKMFVILAFSKHHFEWAVDQIGVIPYVGPYAQRPFVEYLEKQKEHLHRRPDAGEASPQNSSLLQTLFGYVLLVMIAYFVLSIVNSLAQSRAKRKDEEHIHRLFPQQQQHSKPPPDPNSTHTHVHTH